MAAAVYILGTLVALACGVLLLRGYLHGRSKLLLWSSICFFGLSIANFLVFLDLVMFPNTDLYFLRLLTAVIAMLFLLYGLIWEGD
jgi:Family of unknown function (DUF5985)